MKKIYIYCGIVSVLIAIGLVFLALQPRLLPLEEKPRPIVPTSEGESGSSVGVSSEVPVNVSSDLPSELPSSSEAVQSSEIVSEDVSSDTEPIEPYVCPEKLTEAIAKNADVYAWLTIPGTNIDEPVIQSPTDDSYYLRRGIDKKYLSAGMLMTEHSYNGITFEDPLTIIYGHCMKSGAMFGKMQAYYSEEGGMDRYATIEVYLPDKKLEFEVFAAVPYDKRHILYNYDFHDPKIYKAFFKSVQAIRSFSANIVNERMPVYEDKVLILSTCLKGDRTNRYLVMAKLK